MTPVLFPDTVALVVNYLRFELVLRGDGAVVSAGVRSPRPSRFVVVRRVGGTRTTVITDAVTVTVEAWAPTVQEAAEYLEMSVPNFRRYVQRGQITPVQTVGRNQMFATRPLKTFKRILRNRRQPAG